MIRVACEAIRNAARHGDASVVELDLRAEGGRLVLRVRDDGTGFDRSRVPSTEAFGLRSMAERAAAVGGELRIRSEVGTGTVVELAL
jgi:signal transduction histidine kinase